MIIVEVSLFSSLTRHLVISFEETVDRSFASTLEDRSVRFNDVQDDESGEALVRDSLMPRALHRRTSARAHALIVCRYVPKTSLTSVRVVPRARAVNC